MRRTLVAKQSDMGCVILKDSVFRIDLTHVLCDAQVLTHVLCCRDAQARASFAYLDHLGENGHVSSCCRNALSQANQSPSPNTKM